MDKRLRNLEDAYQWSLDTAEALRAGDFSRIDMDELVNEIASIASSLKRELVSLLKAAIEAMLMQDYRCGDASEAAKQLAWAQGELQLLLYSSPSLKEAVEESVAKAYERARVGLVEDYGLALPAVCPLSLERIMEDPYDRLLAEGKFA